ncbi:MAG: acyltransferase [Bacteroidales bacterium]|nr:acyltransferase [Bacteroidales bacterium]
MMDLTEFSDIAPYSDEEASSALTRLSNHPNAKWVSKVIFPDKPETFLPEMLRNIHTVDEFQRIVMNKAIHWVVDTSMTSFTYEGVDILENMEKEGTKYLTMSNHRDIILDPALFQILLQHYKIPETQICVGDNLLKQKSVELLIRSNRMIKVIRGISARELYLSSQLLSKYIRETITSGISSVWIAQRQGRTKDGTDTTEQGLLKMLDMSGTKDFVENFKELNIVPFSISYEYEPCDILKAREILISRTQKYVKGETEDLQSIMMGIRQKKGHVHLAIVEPITEEEIQDAANADKNDRYQSLRHTLDNRIIKAYKLWKTNYMAYDMVNGGSKYGCYYTPEDMEGFKAYVAQRLMMAEPSLDRDQLKDIFLRIYSNPVSEKEQRNLL